MNFAEELQSAKERYGKTNQEMANFLEVPLRTFEDWKAERRTPADYVIKSILEKLKGMTKMIGKYDYEELKEKALKTKSKEDINNLGKWFNDYGSKFWNGEFYDVDGEYRLFEIVKEIEEDEFNVVGYELK